MRWVKFTSDGLWHLVSADDKYKRTACNRTAPYAAEADQPAWSWWESVNDNPPPHDQSCRCCWRRHVQARLGQFVAENRAGRRTVELTLHTHLPDGVPWAKTGYYLPLANGQWRWVAGLIELREGA